jgi:hypothetical protein
MRKTVKMDLEPKAIPTMKRNALDDWINTLYVEDMGLWETHIEVDPVRECTGLTPEIVERLIHGK